VRRGTEMCLRVVVVLPSIPVLTQDVSEISCDSVPNFLKLPAGLHLDEAARRGGEFQGARFCVHQKWRNVAF
jgi:hypothetical protein